MRILIPGLALLAAACTPMPPAVTDPAKPVQSAEAGACAARGGTLKAVGRLQSMQCIMPYADAGKRCTDGDQCQGDCRVEGNNGIAEGRAVSAGVCQVDSDRFGCFTTVEDGKAAATLCVD
jgi:putative hemolysin